MFNDDSAIEVLRAVQEKEPDAHIAGGYLRDMLHGVQWKDIDLFVPVGNLLLDEMEALILKSYPIHKGRFDAAYEHGTGDVLYAWTYGREGHPDLNVIGIPRGRTPQENLETFDFGLSRIALTKDGVVSTPEYKKDSDNNQFTLYRADNPRQVERSLKRYVRIGERYEGWPLVIAPELRPLLSNLIML